MSGYSILVDTSKCTACRGCQIACKQWNQLPGGPTENTGSHQNPGDFNASTYKVVRFSEGVDDKGKSYWYFFTDQCRHCLTPGCMSQNDKDEIVQNELTGAVLCTPATVNLNGKEVLDACPFKVPQQDEKTKLISKCTMCFDRITNNLPPACVKSCPTGAMIFGERDKILELAKTRTAELQKIYPKAKALNADEVRVIFIVTDDPAKYYKFAAGA